jgi:hypothetical protein
VLFLAVIECAFYYYRSTILMFLFLITAICPHSFYVIDKLKYVFDKAWISRRFDSLDMSMSASFLQYAAYFLFE